MKRMEENRENRTNKETAAARENKGKVSRIAKNIMAAGLAVGGAAAFGDMNVFAAENENSGEEVSTETQESTSVEGNSVDILTDAVSVVVSESVVSEPVVTSNDDGSQTTTESVSQTTTTYYVDPSTIGDYENVNENPQGGDRTHLYDQETTVTTTTTTTESSAEENVDVSGRENEAVEDIARDVAGDTDKDGNYNFEKTGPIPSEDGSTTTVTEKGTVTDTEATFEGNTATTTTTTADVVKTTTTETKNDFTNENAAKDWANETGYTNGVVTKGDSITTEVASENDLTEQAAKDAAKKEAESSGLKAGEYTITTQKTGEKITVEKDKTVAGEYDSEEAAKEAAKKAATDAGYSENYYQVKVEVKATGQTISVEGTYKSEAEAQAAAKEQAQKKGLSEGKYTITTEKTGNKITVVTDQTVAGEYDSEEAAKEAAKKAAEDAGYSENYYQVKVEVKATGQTISVEGTYKSEAEAKAAAEALAQGKGLSEGKYTITTKTKSLTGRTNSYNSKDAAQSAANDIMKQGGYKNISINTFRTKDKTVAVPGEFSSYDEAWTAAKNAASAAGADPKSVKVDPIDPSGIFKIGDDIAGIKPKANLRNLFEYNYITTDGDLDLGCHTRGSVYVNGNLTSQNGIDNSSGGYAKSQSYVNGTYDVAQQWDRDGQQFSDTVEKDDTVSETKDGASNSVIDYWNAIAEKIVSLGKAFQVYESSQNSISISSGYNAGGDDKAWRDFGDKVYVYLGTGVVNLNSFVGILLAPNATVSVEGGNFAGSLVGKSISAGASAEAHLLSPGATKYSGAYSFFSYYAEYSGSSYEAELTTEGVYTAKYDGLADEYKAQLTTKGKYTAKYDGLADEYNAQLTTKGMTYAAKYDGLADEYNAQLITKGMYIAKYDGLADGYKASYTTTAWKASRDKVTVQANRRVEKTTKNVTTEKKKQSFYGDKKGENPEVPDVPTTPTTPSTPETPTDPQTPVTPSESAVLGAQRPQEVAAAAPSGGAVLGANRGRHVATGDEANVLASAALAGVSGTGLGGVGLFRRLRNRRNRRNR